MTSIQDQILGLLRAIGDAHPTRACEVGAAVGLTTGEAERELQVLLASGMVNYKMVAAQALWFVIKI
jgi:hypothetical protein